ncbi:hypothetical protein PB2503_07267 [Parvularcula bermudensis HTCC2503]|uniref:COQ9 C-terminal domain-containing protein n=1 Tax=Parvularcula bermudensis (strain ATCC BAA-594 / HTCC2503 / KCTC 12087) TaxID=314260 RepID=E0TEU7_PARBH|nr:COQ9 family protein [Parvularcula bermudensis]ADM09519.1 hypothetical protein PB2503_07267 [Parvularcula bermudensis HTCC2503]
MSATVPNDPLEADRQDVLNALLIEATFEGWTETSLRRAGYEAGLSHGQMANGHLGILFPKGILDVLDYWAALEDRRMADRWAAMDVRPEKIRDKVTSLVRMRISQLTDHREAARRAAATLALPPYSQGGVRHLWRTSGAIWRALGDRSTDFNWYTKRLTLSSVYGSTLTRWFAEEPVQTFDEETEAFPQTWDFLDRRIDNVMAFEKAKGRVTNIPLSPGKVANALGQVRYAFSH